MIKFYCSSCEKKLGVSYEYAGKHIKCPKCKRPNQVPPAEPDVDDVEIIEDADDSGIWSNESYNLSEPTEQAKAKQDDGQPPEKCPKCGYRLNGIHCFNCSYVYSPPVKKTQIVVEAKSNTMAGFSKDLVRSLVPVRSIGDGVVIFILVFLAIFLFMPLGRFFFLITKLGVAGFICTMFFSIIIETANGNDDLPNFAERPDLLSELIRTLLLFLASFLYAVVPGIILSMIYGSLFGGASTNASITELMTCCPIILYGVGLFLWPMLVLTMALGDSFMVRPILLFKSIIKTIIPYLICCGCLYFSAFAKDWILESMAKNTNIFTFALIAVVVWVLVQIYTMRVIGLLYRHYQDRLDW